MTRHAAELSLALTLVLVQTQPVAAVAWHDPVVVEEFSPSATSKSMATTGTQQLHVFYDASTNGQPALYRRSADGGLNWTDAIPISSATASADALAIRSFGTSTLDVLWLQGPRRLYLRSSQNNGSAWGVRVPVTGAAVLSADVARSEERVSVIYTTEASDEIKVRVSMDGGLTFGAGTTVGTTSDYVFGGSPAIIEKNGTITAAWITSVLSDAKLVVRQSTDGVVFGPRRVIAPIADTEIIAGFLSLLGVGANAIIVGYDIDDGHATRAAARTTLDRGATWKPQMVLGGNWSEDPTFAYASGVLRVAYFTCDGANCPTAEVKYKTSPSFGRTWSASSIVTPEPARYTESVSVTALSTGQSVVTFFFQGDLYARTTLAE